MIVEVRWRVPVGSSGTVELVGEDRFVLRIVRFLGKMNSGVPKGWVAKYGSESVSDGVKEPGTDDETAASTASSSEADKDEREDSAFSKSSSKVELVALRLRCQAFKGLD